MLMGDFRFAVAVIMMTFGCRKFFNNVMKRVHRLKQHREQQAAKQ